MSAFLMITIGLVISAVTYGVLFAVSLMGLSLAGVYESTWCHVVAGALLLAGLISAARTRDDYWTQYSFNTTDPKDRISDVHMQGMGGFLWNVNPLGSDSTRSFVKMLSLPIIFGPGILVAGIRELKNIKRTPSEK